MKNTRLLCALSALALAATLAGCGGGSPEPVSPTSETTRAVTVPSKGFQLILLPYWSNHSARNDYSVDNFLSVVKNSRAPQIEFSFLPFAPRPGDPSPSDRFGNATRIIDELRAVGKAPVVTVYLSFHAKGTASDAAISANAATVNYYFLRSYVSKAAAINICPSLEDNGSDADFQRWGGLVAAQIDRSLIGQIAIRRCGIDSHGTVARGSFREVQNEYHGAITGNGTHYSNDGNLVYYPGGRETAASLIGNNPSPQYTLDTFKSNTGGRRGVLLWRPAYNLLWRDDARTPVVFDPTRRNWSDPQTAFGSVEVAVAKSFLGIP